MSMVLVMSQNRAAGNRRLPVGRTAGTAGRNRTACGTLAHLHSFSDGLFLFRDPASEWQGGFRSERANQLLSSRDQTAKVTNCRLIMSDGHATKAMEKRL